MATYNDLCRKFPEMKEALESKGISVEVKNTNPSPDEIIAGINKVSKNFLQWEIDNTRSLAYTFSSSKKSFLSTITRIDENIFNGLNTSNVTSTDNMFYGCSKLTSIPQFDTSNVTNMKAMFSRCSKITTIPFFNTSKVTNMNAMFNEATALTTIPQLDTSNVTDMESMFIKCSYLSTIPQLNTSKVTNMNSMFDSCSRLTTVPELDTSKLTKAYEMFARCTSLQVAPRLNTSNVQNLMNLFSNCSKLTTIPLVDLYSATNVSGLVWYCYALTNLTLKNIKIDLQIGSGTTFGHLLTLDSLINTAKELWDYSSSTGKTLTMGTANLAKITDTYVKLIDVTDEMIAEDPYINNKKPCEVCASTDEGAMTLQDYAYLKNWTFA